ncbi:MAG TPA: site-2 protease family protein, partial [Syntrophomonas sp.]|nr:site-2 protease family protein [Syntrophomonas sp.]
SFTAFLSINLGILNLLPIPALDGSRFVFAIVEAIRRKPMDPEKEGFIHWVGFLFLMGLIVLATYNDIVRLIKG